MARSELRKACCSRRRPAPVRIVFLALLAAACPRGGQPHTTADRLTPPAPLPGGDAAPPMPAGVVPGYRIAPPSATATISARVIPPDRLRPGAPVPPAVVWIDGISAGKAPVPGPVPVAITLRDGRFEPGVVLLPRLDAPLALRNGDPLRHEPIVEQGDRRLAQIPMPLIGQEFLVTPGSAGEVRLTCALHPEERGFALVAGHPYHAATDDDGVARLEEVPPGTYQLVAWQPAPAGPALLGRASVTVAAGDAASVEVPLAR
jgi:hypothetical protein